MSTNNSKIFPIKLIEIEGQVSRLEVWALGTDAGFAVIMEQIETKKMVSIPLDYSDMDKLVSRISARL